MKDKEYIFNQLISVPGMDTNTAKLIAEKIFNKYNNLEFYKKMSENGKIFNFIEKLDVIIEEFKEYGMTLTDTKDNKTGRVNKGLLTAAINNERVLLRGTDAIKNSVNMVMNYFEENGCQKSDYIRMCMEAPSIMTITGNKIIGKIEKMAQAYEEYNVPVSEIINMFVNNSGLLTYDIDGLIKKPELMYKHFSAYGISREEVFMSFKKKSTLFVGSAKDKIDSFNIIMFFARKGIFTLKKDTNFPRLLLCTYGEQIRASRANLYSRAIAATLYKKENLKTPSFNKSFVKTTMKSAIEQINEFYERFPENIRDKKIQSLVKLGIIPQKAK